MTYFFAKKSTLSLLIFASINLHQPVAAQHNHGKHGAEHDTATMPGLRGDNASTEESDEIRLLFRNFETIYREVTNLPNGIRTVTWSTEFEVMAVLTSHAIGMIDRVERNDDPKILIQSPTLDSLFRSGVEIESKLTVENNRLIITQTSENPELIKDLQTHAAEVTAMSERGMEAVHEMMTEREQAH